MRLIVLDTNCLIQVLPARSRYHKVWTGFLAGHYRLCVSTEILNEYEEILAEHMSPEIAHNVVEAIARHPLTYFCESFFFVDCAITAGADFIVTEDTHFNHLKQIPFPKITVLTLDEFYGTFIINQITAATEWLQR